jgi:hypothetical protein
MFLLLMSCAEKLLLATFLKGGGVGWFLGNLHFRHLLQLHIFITFASIFHRIVTLSTPLLFGRKFQYCCKKQKISRGENICCNLIYHRHLFWSMTNSSPTSRNFSHFFTDGFKSLCYQYVKKYYFCFSF